MNATPTNGHGRRSARGSRGERAKPLPHNLDAEQSILGGVILKPALLREIDSLVTAAFYDMRNQVVWEAIRNLQNEGRPIDVVTLEVEIERAGKLEALGGLRGVAGGIEYLGELATRVPTAENVVVYAKIVRDAHLIREVALKAERIAARAADWQYEADELLGEQMAELQQLERGYREGNEKIPFITLADSLDEIDRLSRTPIFETPFPELNRALGFDGLLAGQVYYLAGGTGFGKTSWLARVVRHHASSGRWALIAFWEMFAGYYTAKMSAALIGVHANQILRGRVDREHILASLPPTIQMLDAPSMSLLRRAVEHHQRLGRGAPLIVVDYLQLLTEQIMATMLRPDPRLATAQASAGLRTLAKETGSAIIVVSAAGRAASKELTKDVRKKPARDLISASRESGSVEFDGAGVIVLSVSDEKDGDEDIATISVAKARFGETRHIDARFDGRTGDWREIGRVASLPAKNVVTKVDDGKFREQILEAISKSGGIASKTKIQQITGRNKASVLSEVDVMVDVGILVSTPRGFSLSRELEPVPDELQSELPEVG